MKSVDPRINHLETLQFEGLSISLSRSIFFSKCFSNNSYFSWYDRFSSRSQKNASEMIHGFHPTFNSTVCTGEVLCWFRICGSLQHHTNYVRQISARSDAAEIPESPRICFWHKARAQRCFVSRFSTKSSNSVTDWIWSDPTMVIGRLWGGNRSSPPFCQQHY